MFSYETQLAAPVTKWLRDSGGICVAEEVEVGFGIPDMMAGLGTPRSLHNRRRQARPVTDALQLALLEFCRVTRSEDELRNWAPNGFANLNRRAIRPLIEAEMMRVSIKGYRSRRNPRDPFDSLIAVELKLRATTRGFAQAYAYQLFAEASYLAVPADRADEDSINRAHELGIGLLRVHEETCIEVVRPTSVKLTTPSRRRIASERILAASQKHGHRLAGSPIASLA